MSNYTKTTDFAAKDSLPAGNAAKTVRGSELEKEFDEISSAISTKADIAGVTFTGPVEITTLTFNGTLSTGTISGGTY